MLLLARNFRIWQQNASWSFRRLTKILATWNRFKYRHENCGSVAFWNRQQALILNPLQLFVTDSPFFFTASTAHCFECVDALQSAPFSNGVWLLAKDFGNLNRCVRFFDCLLSGNCFAQIRVDSNSATSSSGTVGLFGFGNAGSRRGF